MSGRIVVMRHCFAVLFTLAIGGAAPAIAVADGALQFFETTHDFGPIKGVERRLHEFSFRNAADSVIRILSVTPSCGCTAAKPEKTEYQPGETGHIHAEFNPAGQKEHHESSIIVEDDSGGKYVLTLAADIQTLDPATLKINLPDPVIRVTPDKVNLGTFKVGEAALFKVIVENKGDGDLFIIGDDAPDEAGVRLGERAIKKGKKIELTLFYKPEKAGKINDFVSIRSNDPKNPELKIHLTGKALRPKKTKNPPNRNNHK